MKRFLTRTVVFLFCISTLLSSSLAVEATQFTERVDYGDGSFLTIITTVSPALTRTSTRYATKEIVYTDAVGDKAFSYTLQGWFTYDNQTSRATDASAEMDIFKPGWSLTTHREYCSGSTAYGSATFKGPTGSRTVSATLTCDRYGNVD